MKTTIEYLESVRAKLDLPSDYAISKALGVTRESVSGWRNGKSPFGIETAMKIGEILGEDGHAIYAHGQIERAKKPEIADFWKDISEKFSASFRNLLLGYGPHVA
ncbi:helix-turn-helix domain-containing protein [Duganella radicis]|uniref:Helix-turn-helix domain-containing protein n=1 Tax=Duganella radicis TaxID=551988 RepID=A0A6L6PD20_9BURK|nr:helix-turn-helix domain-containing protein [Duganella radicis]MTV36265.1 helix-turn-helix domain-containing protein [Duganella radicis]